MNANATGRVGAAVLMPHAPVLIPEVGCGRERQAARTVDALHTMATELVRRRPGAIVVISPHSPRRPGKFGLWKSAVLAGDMARFGHPETTLELANDLELVRHLEAALAARSLPNWGIPEGPLDHGAFVPLSFLVRAGWHGPTVVMGLNLPGEGGWRSAGSAIAEAVALRGGEVVVLASGDMSHRLLPGAPAGYDPRAVEFDREFVRLIEAGDFAGLARIDPALQEDAAEDVVDSSLIAAHAIGLRNAAHQVLSYEGPFGVGYCVARLFREATDEESYTRAASSGHEPLTRSLTVDSSHGGQCLPAVAREAVLERLRGIPANGHWPLNEFLDRSAGVFVTIRRRGGELRGCRGTIIGRQRNLVEETRAVAVMSALNDDRFPPLDAAELDDLRFEVSVLNPAEPVPTLHDLDPARYGLIISTADGRRGLMLPAVEGLDTVEAQLSATRRKAGIAPGEAVSLARFTVEQFAEEDG